MARAADPVRARAAAAAVVRTLRDRGHEAYFAGGCVRDELLGLHPTDFDVATDATPPVVRSLFRGTHEVGEAFGVLLVPRDGCVIEVATFRAEGTYSDSRRPDSVRFSTPADDAARRDFTINALFLDPLAPPEHGAGSAAPGVRGRVIDLVGGLADLRAGVLRAVGDPDARLTEDHLRALRAVRFAARLGFEIEPATASAIARHAAELRGVSRERVGQEVRRMLAHPARARAAAIMQQLGLDAAALNEPATAPAAPALQPMLPSMAALTPEAAFPVALAAWALDRHAAAGATAASPGGGAGPAGLLSPEAARAVIARWRGALCLSNEERACALAALEGAARLVAEFHGLGVAGQKRLAAAEWFPNAMALLVTRRPGDYAQISRRVGELAEIPPGIAPIPIMNGDDLVMLGFRPGPRFKRLLDRLYDEQLEGRLSDRARAEELLREWGV